jgi:hypothetical protein
MPRIVAIFVSVNPATSSEVVSISRHPWRDRPGPINGSLTQWHDHVTDVPDDVTDAEVLRRYRQCTLHKTHIARFADLRPGAIIRERRHTGG